MYDEIPPHAGLDWFPRRLPYLESSAVQLVHRFVTPTLTLLDPI